MLSKLFMLEEFRDNLSLIVLVNYCDDLRGMVGREIHVNEIVV